MFIGEALPALIFGFLCFVYLPDRPASAKWLNDQEKRWLEEEMQKEKKTVTAERTFWSCNLVEPARAGACCHPFWPGRS